MPTYEVDIPGSGKYSVDSPSDLTDQQAYFAVMQRIGQQEKPAEAPVAPVAIPKRAEDVGFLEGIGAAGRRGIESMGDVASGLGLAGTSLTGTDEETRRKMQAIRAEQLKPQQTPGTTFADLERIYKEKGLMSALGNVPKYAAEQIIQSAPQMAAPLAAGAAASPFITPIGGALVGMGVYGVQQFGNFLVRQAVEKEDPRELEVAKAALTAAGTAPIGYFADRFTVGLGSLGKSAGKEIVEELAKRSGMDLAGGVAKQVGKGAVEGIIAEAPTEVLEQAAERYQAGLSLSDPDAMNEYKEAFFGAAAAGGGIKGVSTGLDLRSGIQQARQPEAEIPENLLPPEAATSTTESGQEAEAIRGLEQGVAFPGMQPEQQAAPQAEQVQPTPQEFQQPETVSAPQGFTFDPTPFVERHSIDGVPAMTPALANDIGNYVMQQIEQGNTVLATAPDSSPVRVEGFENGILIGEGGMRLSPFWFTNTDGQGSGLQIINPQEQKPTEVEAPSEYAPEQQAALDFIAAVDQGGVPLNPTRIRSIAEGLGLEVQRSASPAETIQRIREATQRFEPVKATAKPLPEDLHPIEAMTVPGQEQAHKEAVDKAKAAGVNPVLSKLTGRINPEKTTVDWNTIEQFPTVGGLLDHIKDHVPVDYKGIIKKILPTVKNIPLSAVPVIQDRNGKRTGWLGAYRPTLYKDTGDIKSHRIELSVAARGNDISTILHETLHGATTANYYRGKAGDPRYAPAVKDLDSLTRKLVKLQKEGKINIPFFNDYERANLPRELISWGQTDRDVQRELKSVVLQNKKTAWSEFVNTMRKLLGLPANQTTALEHLMDISERLTSDRDVMETAPIGQTHEEVVTKNRQEFAIDMANMSQRTKALGGPAPEATWEMAPLESETGRSQFLNNKVYEYLDKFVDIKDIIKAINTSTKTNAKKLDETWNAYRRETLYHNRVAFMTNHFLTKDLKPLAEDMVKRNVTEEELNNYLLARFAEERNQEINERNESPELRDRGSGVESRIARAYMLGATPQQVQAIRDALAKDNRTLNVNEEALLKDLAKMNDAKRKNLAAIAKRIDSIVQGTQDIAVAGGLESKETIKYWRDKYPNYAPLKRSPEELDFVEKNYGAGKGFSTKSGFGRAATGSLKTVDNIMANIILQRDMAIVRAEKARIGRALYAMALQNPNTSFWLPVNPEAGVIAKANDLGLKIANLKEKISRKIEKVDADLAAGKNMDEEDLKEIENLRKQLSRDVDNHNKLSAQAETARQNIAKELSQFEGQGLTAEDINNLIREPQGAWYNPATGKVEYKSNAYLRSSPNVLAVPVDGETRYIFFNPSDTRAKRLVNSLKSADVEQMGQITSTVGKFTRYIAQVNTQFNPFFGIVNMLRDIQGAQLNLTSTPLAGKKMAVNARIPGAMATVYRSLRSERNGGDALGPYAKDWKEFQERGGPTGIKDMLAREQDKLSVLGEEISKLQENPTKKAGRKALESAFGLMSDFNDTMENAVRLSAFVEAKAKFKEQGFSNDVAADKAAELAKNLTVNFNRKGAKTQFVNSWFAFFNAAIQGSARLAETLKGPAGKKIITSLIGMGVIQQLMLASASFKDDDPPEFVRSKNLIFPTSDGKYISFPMPLGFNALVNVGRITTAAFMDGGKHPSKYLEDFAGAMSDSFNPLGSSGLSMQTLAPTIADPLLALESNKDAFGRPIYREDRANKPTPGYLRSSEGANEISRGIAKFMNMVTGGTDYQKGAISPTADEIDYLAGQLGGGTYREAKKVVEYAKSKASDEEVAPYKVPLAGRFMGDTGSEANARSQFYQNITQLSKYEDEIKGRAKNHEDVQAFLREHPEARLFSAANSVENDIIQINKMRKEMIARGASQEQLKRLNEMKIQRMRQFNALVDKATQQ